MESLAESMREQPAMPRFEDGSVSLRELVRRLAEDVVNAIMDAEVEQLLQVNDVGPVVAESIHTFFAQPHNREVVEQLRACGVHWSEGEPAEKYLQHPESEKPDGNQQKRRNHAENQNQRPRGAPRKQRCADPAFSAVSGKL